MHPSLNRISKWALVWTCVLLSLALFLPTATAVIDGSLTNRPGSQPPPSAPAASSTTTPAAPIPSAHTQSAADQIKQRWLLSGLILVLLGAGAYYLTRKPSASAKQ
ncbi:MAG: hypothetical protein JWR19_1430 [Pedosphaera sp.]|nr:hypothetical protein [Pedosphaera sp.]